ncbi:MAG: hypothetical protein ATN36_06700 [Epulopiscium sp. Nele67-Bin005]|nr:MAG: hypothetical protein ATN36_06700 [Epulopiscium sp. Nele67-Bin005]
MKNDLRELRLRRGLSQSALAQMIGICEVSYARKERGQREFSASEIAKLAQVLKLKPTAIVKIFLT